MENKIICKKCGSSNIKIFSNNDRKTSICQECGFCEDLFISEELLKKWEQEKTQIEQKNSKPIVECPYCHSIDTNKISSLSKAGRVALFGIFAVGKTTKQFHCNTCKADF